MIGGVGQRVLTGVAKKTAGEFFSAVDDVLTGKAAAVPVPAPRGEPVGVVAGAAATPGVYTAPGGGPAAGGALSSDFLKGAVFGAVVALLGALVGALGARRRT
jgi:hypothetical protein